MTDREKEVRNLVVNLSVHLENDQVDAIVQLICQLFEPKPAEGRLLGDITVCVVYTIGGVCCGILNDESVAKINSIKDAECQARVERIFKEIESMALGKNCFHKTILFQGDILIRHEDGWWQDLSKCSYPRS